MKQQRRILYDSKCWELADAFLSDVPHLATVQRIEELSGLIQQTIESYIKHAEDNYDGGEP